MHNNSRRCSRQSHKAAECSSCGTKSGSMGRPVYQDLPTTCIIWVSSTAYSRLSAIRNMGNLAISIEAKRQVLGGFEPLPHSNSNAYPTNVASSTGLDALHSPLVEASPVSPRMPLALSSSGDVPTRALMNQPARKSVNLLNRSSSLRPRSSKTGGARPPPPLEAVCGLLVRHE